MNGSLKPTYGTAEWVDALFTRDDVLADDQYKNIDTLRAAYKNLVGQILVLTPKCADQTASIRQLRESLATAEGAIQLQGLV